MKINMKNVIMFWLLCLMTTNCKVDVKDTVSSKEIEPKCNIYLVREKETGLYTIHYNIGISRDDSISNRQYLINPNSRVYFNDRLPCIENALKENQNIRYVECLYYYDFKQATDITQLAIANHFTSKYLRVGDARPMITFLEDKGYFDQIKILFDKYGYKIDLIAAERVTTGKFKGNDGKEAYYPIGLDQLIIHIEPKDK